MRCLTNISDSHTQEVTAGGSFKTFVLNTHTGTIERAWKDSQASQSNYILSIIIGILLVAVGALMYTSKASIGDVPTTKKN